MISLQGPVSLQAADVPSIPIMQMRGASRETLLDHGNLDRRTEKDDR